MLQLLWFDDIMTKRSKSLKLYFNTSNATISKRLSARVSTDLIEKYSRKTIRIRIGDTVKILTGQYKNIEGKITHVYTNENKISIEDIVRNKFQPRKNFDKDNLEELTNSIKEQGVIQPIVVRPAKSMNNKY